MVSFPSTVSPPGGASYSAPLLWLAAWLALAIILAPLAAAAALKISLT